MKGGLGDIMQQAQTMQAELVERERDDDARRFGHVAVSGIALADPIAERGERRGAAADALG